MATKKFDHLKKEHYQAIRQNIHTGDIFFASGNYAISKMIEHFSNSIFSHVGFIFTWNDRILLLESVEDDGVRVVPLSQYVNDYKNSKKPYDGRIFIARYNTPLDTDAVNKMLGTAADNLNRKYDKDEIAKILARVTLRLGTHKENDAYICSEFVDICFQSIGIKFLRDPEGYIFPEHIAADIHVVPKYEIVA